MNLQSYLEHIGQSIHAFSKQSDISYASLWRACHGIKVSAPIADRIQEKTGGAVPRDTLVKWSNEQSPHDSQPLKTQSILNRLIKKYNDFIRR